MIICLPPEEVAACVKTLEQEGETAITIGEIRASDEVQPKVEFS